MDKEMRNNDLCAHPDWEIECNKLAGEYHKLCEVNEQLKAKLADSDYLRREMEQEVARLRAQLDIVYLIFGKGR